MKSSCIADRKPPMQSAARWRAVREGDIQTLRDITGPLISRTRLEELLEAASGDVGRAVDLHFGLANHTGAGANAASDDDVEVVDTLADHATWQPRPTDSTARTLPRASRQAGTSAWQALNDYVELDSSTDNDFDPGNR